jgi:hypothetical protein
MDRRLFTVIASFDLEPAPAPQLKVGQEGFAYMPLSDPVQIEIDNLQFTASLSGFERSIIWKPHSE